MMPKAVSSFIPVLITFMTGCTTTPADDGAVSPSEVSAQPLTEEAASAPCYSRVDGRVVALDLATETITATPHDFVDGDLSSLGLTQNHLVGCATAGELVEILDLATGATTSVDLSCDAATALGDRIYVQSLSTQTLTEYANLSALIAKQPVRELPAPFATRIGAGNGRLLAAWHSDDEVLAVSLETGTTTAIPLPGYDGWIFGVFEDAEVRLVTGGWVETGINVFDVRSDRLRGRLFDGVWLQGLACSTP